MKNAKEIILQELIQYGWNPVSQLSMDHTTAVAEKVYLTIVGAKTAIAYVHGPVEGKYYITANYESEGRNVLSTSYLKTDLTTIKTEIATLTKNVDGVISKTYAMALVIRGQAAAMA